MLLDPSHLASQALIFSSINRKKDSTLRQARKAEGSVSFISSALHRPRERPLDAYHIPTALLPGVDLSELIHMAESWGWPWTPNRPACTSLIPACIGITGIHHHTYYAIMGIKPRAVWGRQTLRQLSHIHDLKDKFWHIFPVFWPGRERGPVVGEPCPDSGLSQPSLSSLCPQDTWLAVVKVPQVFTIEKTLTWPTVQLGPV